MKVLYEISNLGLTFEEKSWRTGIFRVSAELLERLAAAPEIDVALASFYSFIGEIKAAEYLQREKPQLLPRLLNVWRNPRQCLAATDAIAPRVPLGEDAESLRRRGELRREMNELLELPLREDFDIVHSFHHPLPPHERARVRHRILHVHDVIPLLLPEAVTDPTRVHFEEWLASVDVERDWIITVSECSKRDFCAHTGMAAERVFVVPNAAAAGVFHPETDVAKREEVLRRYGLQPPYILALSTLEPRKNLLHLIECFFELCRTGEAGEARLVLVGPEGWLFEPTLERWRREPRFRERVVFTGYVADADLSSLYSAARLFVYVSRYEGFGLPPLEAMSCGVPVIASSTSSLPEVVGDAGILVDPDDGDALRDAMRRLLTDADLGAALGAKARERAARFSWERSAAEIVEVYRRVCASV